MEIELQKKHVKDPLTHEIRKLHLEANRASKLENRHQHCIGDETVKKQVSERFTCPCLTVPGGFISGSFTSEQIHQDKMLHLRN